MVGVDSLIVIEFDVLFMVENVFVGYWQGIFLMGDDEDDLVYWFWLDLWVIILLDGFYVFCLFQCIISQGEFEIIVNKVFVEVMIGCGEGCFVWIIDWIYDFYNQLYELKRVYFIEVWSGKELVGGIYGVQVGGVFMVELKFYWVIDVLKVVLVKLVEQFLVVCFCLLEVQYLIEYFWQFGVCEIFNVDYFFQLESVVMLECFFQRLC